MKPRMRFLAIGLAIAVIVFLPLLFLPLGLFSFGHRRSRRGRGF